MKNRPIYGRIQVDYAPMQDLSLDIKMMPKAFGGYHLLLVITCNQTNFTIAIPLRDRTAQTIAEALIYRVIYLFGPPRRISIPLTLRNNVRILPRKTGMVTLNLRPNKTSFMPRHTIIGKGIAYVKPLDQTLPLRPIEIEFENNHCSMEVHNTSDSTV